MSVAPGPRPTLARRDEVYHYEHYHYEDDREDYLLQELMYMRERKHMRRQFELDRRPRFDERDEIGYIRGYRHSSGCSSPSRSYSWRSEYEYRGHRHHPYRYEGHSRNNHRGYAHATDQPLVDSRQSDDYYAPDEPLADSPLSAPQTQIPVAEDNMDSAFPELAGPNIPESRPPDTEDMMASSLKDVAPATPATEPLFPEEDELLPMDCEDIPELDASGALTDNDEDMVLDTPATIAEPLQPPSPFLPPAEASCTLPPFPTFADIKERRFNASAPTILKQFNFPPSGMSEGRTLGLYVIRLRLEDLESRKSELEAKIAKNMKIKRWVLIHEEEGRHQHELRVRSGKGASTVKSAPLPKRQNRKPTQQPIITDQIAALGWLQHSRQLLEQQIKDDSSHLDRLEEMIQDYSTRRTATMNRDTQHFDRVSSNGKHNDGHSATTQDAGKCGNLKGVKPFSPVKNANGQPVSLQEDVFVEPFSLPETVPVEPCSLQKTVAEKNQPDVVFKTPCAERKMPSEDPKAKAPPARKESNDKNAKAKAVPPPLQLSGGKVLQPANDPTSNIASPPKVTADTTPQDPKRKNRTSGELGYVSEIPPQTRRWSQDDQASKSRNIAPKPRRNPPRPQDSAPMSRNNAPKCRDNDPRHRNNGPKPRDNAPRSQDNVSKSRGNAPKSQASVPKSQPNVPKSQDNTPKTRGEHPNFRDNALRISAYRTVDQLLKDMGMNRIPKIRKEPPPSSDLPKRPEVGLAPKINKRPETTGRPRWETA